MNLRVYAILDERSLADDTILVIEVSEDDEYFGVRMECSLAIPRMLQYEIGDMGIDEDMEEAAETADGVFRLGLGGCGEGCRCVVTLTLTRREKKTSALQNFEESCSHVAPRSRAVGKAATAYTRGSFGMIDRMLLGLH